MCFVAYIRRGFCDKCFTYLYGKYKTVKDLTGNWATDPQYDKKLMKFIREIEGTKADVSASNMGSSKKSSVIEDMSKGLKKGLFKPFKKK